MRELADLASWLVQDCHGATMTLWRDGEPEIVVASHPLVATLAETDRNHGGPIRHAVNTSEGRSLPDLAAEQRWPYYRLIALSGGLRAVLVNVEPMRTAQLTLAVYSTRPGSFGPPVDPMHAMLVGQVAAGVRNAVEYDESRRDSAQSRQALDSRVAVERAKGVLMAEEGRGEDAAFARLRSVAQGSGRKVFDVASDLLDRGYDDWHEDGTERSEPRPGS